jgi:hypothetical protein
MFQASGVLIDIEWKVIKFYRKAKLVKALATLEQGLCGQVLKNVLVF